MHVTCICPTMASRKAWLPRAVECFLAQDYADRDLLIMLDPDCNHPELPADPRISVLRTPEPLKVGVKRNRCAEKAAGPLIAHWDDDDWSAPGRLSQQVAHLEASGAEVTGYRWMIFTDGERWWEYLGREDYVCDSSVMYHKSYWAEHPFSPVKRNFDQLFIKQAFDLGALSPLSCECMMVVTNHPGNTSPRIFMEGPSFRRIERPAGVPEVLIPA